MIMRFLLITIITIFLCGCSNSTQNNETSSVAATVQTAPLRYASDNIEACAHLYTYDVYQTKLDEGYGVYITQDIIVTPMLWVKGAQSTKQTPIQNKQLYNIMGYVSYSLPDDLVALRTTKRIAPELVPLKYNATVTTADTLHYLTSLKRKTYKNYVHLTADSLIANGTGSSISQGIPLFNNKGELCGITGANNRFVNISKLKALPQPNGQTNIYQLRLVSDKNYPKASGIYGARIHTTMGNIELKLLDQVPDYKENFIRLTTDGFYDGLLIHRVLADYLIQTGAADSRNAKPGDNVGWQGPGYTMPMHIVPGLFHKRGMIAASKLPQEHNSSNRCDGSQFYIVLGRIFTPKELADVERDYNKKFTAEQRNAYTTVGGAPYLDGDYTVFAEVTKGLDVAQRISQVALDGDRPVDDIRITKMELIRK